MILNSCFCLWQIIHVKVWNFMMVCVRCESFLRPNEKVKAVIEEVEKEMNGDGRILVRPSGTEPLVRVMAEAKTKELCEKYVGRIADVVKAEMGAE